MRLVLLLASMLLLGACNVAMSPTPLFTAADEAGAPPLKPGLWVIEDADCHFSETRPYSRWPTCAGGGVVRPGELMGYDRDKGKGVWEHMPLVFAAGDPRILQGRVNDDAAKAEPYGFAAARVTKTDPRGRAIAIDYWLVQCGPPPPKRTKPDDPMIFGTAQPLPGMQMKPGESECIAASADAVRAAAKVSEGWADKIMRAHWVRAGNR